MTGPTAKDTQPAECTVAPDSGEVLVGDRQSGDPSDPAAVDNRLGFWIGNRRTRSCVLCSPRLLEIFGVTDPEFRLQFASPELMRRRIDPLDADRYCTEVTAALAAARPYDIAYRIVTPAGVSRSVREIGEFGQGGQESDESEVRIVQDATEARWHPLDMGAAHDRLANQADHFAMLAADLEVARRHADEARRLAEEASRAKSEFLANMSHELRTPLNAVIGFAQIMSAEMFGNLGNDRYREYCRDILSSGNHLLEVINQLLDLSRIEAGRTHLQDEEVDLSYVVDVCQKLVRERAERKQLTFASHCAKLPPIRGDDRSLRQILLNLLSNAVKFTTPGGLITIDGALDPSGNIRISVIDTGVGIPPDQLARIGEPFAQGRNSLVTEEIGTGLGLSIVKSLIELHGGRLEITSEVSVGTTASIYLPADRVLPEPPPG